MNTDRNLTALFFVHSLNFNGITRHTLDLTRGFKSLGFNPFVIALDDGPMLNSFSKADIPIVVAKAPERYPINNVQQYINNIKILLGKSLIDPQIVIVCSFFSLWGYVVANELSLPTICILHDNPPLDENEYSKLNYWHYPLPPFKLLKKTLKDMSKIVTVCKNAYMNYKSAFNLDNILTIHNGLDKSLDTLRFDQDELKSLKAKDNSILITQVGTICERKGQYLLVEAFSNIKKEYNNIKLLLLGARGATQAEVNYINKIKNFSQAHNLGKDIIIKESTDKIGKYLAQTDIFAFPSICESFPYATLEAMHFGIPIVASKISGLPEQIRHGYNGFLHIPGDRLSLEKSLKKLVGDENLRKVMGERGKKMLEANWRANTMVNRYAKLVKAVVSRKDKYSLLKTNRF